MELVQATSHSKATVLLVGSLILCTKLLFYWISKLSDLDQKWLFEEQMFEPLAVQLLIGLYILMIMLEAAKKDASRQHGRGS